MKGTKGQRVGAVGGWAVEGFTMEPVACAIARLNCHLEENNTKQRWTDLKGIGIARNPAAPMGQSLHGTKRLADGSAGLDNHQSQESAIVSCASLCMCTCDVRARTYAHEATHHLVRVVLPNGRLLLIT